MSDAQKRVLDLFDRKLAEREALKAKAEGPIDRETIRNKLDLIEITGMLEGIKAALDAMMPPQEGKK